MVGELITGGSPLGRLAAEENVLKEGAIVLLVVGKVGNVL